MTLFGLSENGGYLKSGRDKQIQNHSQGWIT